MRLAKYFDLLPRTRRGVEIDRIAHICDVTPMAVRYWASGDRAIAPEQAVKIVKHLGGIVSIEDLIPALKDLEPSGLTESLDSSRPPNPELFWLVWREGSGGPTKKHDTLESAHAEADRLSKKFIDDKFYVLAPVQLVQSMAVTLRMDFSEAG